MSACRAQRKVKRVLVAQKVLETRERRKARRGRKRRRVIEKSLHAMHGGQVGASIKEE